jgi:hypothetical protein
MALLGLGAYGHGPDPDDPTDLRTDDSPLANLAAIAGKVESGEIGLPPRWGFERTQRGTQVWTIPNGRAFECDDQGRLLQELPAR